ncbi:hypothetical protein IEN85_13495 [Pelagicoccus sp. NFK12]|uniref:MOSC domain-containing protein n=1 Tax=Pelagicoccus enzymogenes TaxID=2773457 RepID=A0A927II59_9BACT|nr:MOSC domain-containing protein [Pelagicoccus enzymogenes]MBD5780509.1 hypothetical protein [Pelagicoccus enzymogenes]MDQ8197591.1 hypothetical protein [Pelagicoccus enzymogenes]
MSQHATLEFLNARRDWVLAAPKDNAPILTLCLRPELGERSFVSSLQLDPKQGVVGDRWIRKTWMYTIDGKPDPRIQVCLLGSRVLQLIRRDPDGMTYPGDNIIADMDFSESNLPVGQRLQIGSAIIEVSDVFNTACSKWNERHGSDSIKWINLPENKEHRFRGILCRVVQAGEVTLTDKIQKA